jgi:hypothetical protein
MMRRHWLISFLALALATPALAAPPAATARTGANVPTPTLDTTRAVEVRNVTLDWGAGKIVLDSGILVPAAHREGRSRDAELVFVGEGRLQAPAPDPIEAAQLELFTGAAALDVGFERAVLVLPGAGPRVLARGTAVGATRATGAAEVWDSWQRGPYRRLLGVESTLFGAALGDPWSTPAFAGWFAGAERGDLVAVVDPTAGEQVTVGQFVPLELTDREQRSARRELHREQRRGRLLGVTLDQLGSFDTWMSTSLRRDGEPRAGFAPLVAEHFALEVDLGRPEGNLAATARVRLRRASATTAPRVVTLQLHGDLVVSAVAVDGAPVAYVRDGDAVTLEVPSGAGEGKPLEVAVTYAGQILVERQGRAYSLRDTMAWFPRPAELQPATYDVRIEWPERLTLVASGERTGSGVAPDRRWERRRLDVPVLAFGIELGAFDEVAPEVEGRVPVRLYLDRQGKGLTRELRREIVDTAAQSLAFYEETFGPYPFGSLSLVTGDQLYSQALPGVINLSTLMMSDLGWVGLVLGLPDRKTVVAHEVAHQWWGHQVGWKSYRDIWIAEALATYSSLVFAREKLDLTTIVGPTAGWEEALSRWRDDDRPVEAVGPLVLGARLDSTRTGDAYEAIVYRKGAVVLDMLSTRFGEEGFLAMLKGVVGAAKGRVISTAQLLDLFERLSGSDLDAFAERLVYSTGLPEVYYDVAFEKLADGGWRIHGEARQQLPYRFRYRAVRDGDVWDVRREVVAAAAGPLQMVVPIRVPVLNPEGPKLRRGEDANGTQEGHLIIQAERTAIDMKLDYEPKELWLDPDDRVFARFWNARRAPRRMAFYEALDLAAIGRGEEAERRMREALTLPAGVDDEDDGRQTQRELEGRVHLELARLALDRGDEAAAERELAQARERFSSTSPWREDVDLLELRLAVRRGAYADAARRLSKAVLRRGDLDATEAWVLLAIAAKESGDEKGLVAAREVAARRGADLSALD